MSFFLSNKFYKICRNNFLVSFFIVGLFQIFRSAFYGGVTYQILFLIGYFIISYIFYILYDIFTFKSYPQSKYSLIIFIILEWFLEKIYTFLIPFIYQFRMLKYNYLIILRTIKVNEEFYKKMISLFIVLGLFFLTLLIIKHVSYIGMEESIKELIDKSDLMFN